jgi:Zn-dependent protease with chaperone function
MKYTPRLPEENVNVSPGGPLREFAQMFAGAVALLLLVYILLGAAVDLIVPHISPSLERAIGRHLLGTMPRADVPDVRERILQTILNELQESCIDLPYEPTVHFVDRETVNAVALPGGHILVFSGLVEKLHSLNEAAFVLAHEAGHFKHRDHLRALGRSLVLMTMSAALFGGDSRIGGVLSGWLNIAEMGFSRQQETRADEYGLRVLNCRFGHVSGATAFFETLAREDKTGLVRHYFSTHPRNQKRIAHIKAYSDQQGFPRGRLNPLPKELRTERGPSGAPAE